MSDTLSEEQIEFNDFIATIKNYKRIEASEFEKNPKVKRLFDMHFFRLKNEGYASGIFDKELEVYFKERYIDNPEEAYNKVFAQKKGRLIGTAIKDFFQIKNLNLAISISSPEYKGLPSAAKVYEKYRVRTRKFIDKSDYNHYKRLKNKANGKSYKEELIIFKRYILRQKIKEWHLYCIAINQAEDFIKLVHDDWGKTLSKPDRRQRNIQIKVLARKLEVFDNNIFNSIALHDIANTTKYTFNSLKTEKLLSYSLPQIDTKAKAKAITEDLLPPYN